MISSNLSNRLKEKRKIIKNTREIIHTMAVELGERTLVEYNNLNSAREYIGEYFARYAHKAVEETYTVDGREVANVMAEIKGFAYPDSIIVIGAHYDTVEGSPGADDNASAVAALLELYRLVSPYQFKRTVRFVAFTLEEPPFFSTDLMGSMQHAANCRKRKEQIDLMICLEMVGYASRKGHQEFPMNHLKGEYPKYGNFFGVVSLPSMCGYVHLWKKVYNDYAKHKIFDFVGPASIPGMDLSDHNSFIKAGYPALMLTDTGFYRNKNYHTPGDTFDTINFTFLWRNIWNTSIALREILNMDELLSVNT